MDASRNNRFFLELRFWERGVSDRILTMLSGAFSTRLLGRRENDADAWYRLEVSGDSRKIRPLRRLGRRLGFYVGTPGEAVA